ncbi:SDR family oxidoreductase [Synechococcus sp. UW140]|jgi:2,3-dihydro-2,3-dihydroxybenzoate dehydrogenase|uniref:SDR family NAD(P)-dependent oxidoreductase n=1 Tax=Synechococcus sp. UW140 TaxID=368503 RepID=UPI003137F5BE
MESGTTVVVGAAHGIGAAIAHRVARELWTTRLVLAGISNAQMDSLASTLRSDRLQVDVLHVDLADECSIAALVEKSNEAERVAIASGIYISSSALTTSRAEIDSVLAINLYGVFFTAQHYARAMISRKSGSIVAIGSISGRFPRLGQVAYGAAKAGMRQALRVLALETVPHGVRINLISPGPTESEMMRKLIADHPNMANLADGNLESFRPPIPDAHVGQPDQVAAAAAFLLSPDSSHISFHDLYLDGGETLGI